MSFVLLADPEIAAVATEESGEPLVDLAADGGLPLDDRKRDRRGAFALLRAGVAERLLAAQARLPGGLRLLVVEGYRPPMLQRRYFDQHRERLAALQPQWDAATLRREASKYVAPPEVAPHCTGGAVDLTLCGPQGAELDLGTAVNASPEESDGACFTAAANIGSTARANRAILIDALGGAGLVNYPTEWWHWSYGERYWAHANRTYARYGRMDA